MVEDVTSITDVRHVELDGQAYRIMENSEKHTITTTPPLGTAFKGGLINGLALGMANVLPGKAQHYKAARKYLDETDRAECSIKSGFLVVEPRYRFLYVCPQEEEKSGATGIGRQS
ncbi:hypothetical protein [Cohaesibacter marisflavi]|uniref:hypothetical protein n=1 Tax=Cohaesibacter marisflavi TaxID=655353 RepID=UPI0029C70F4F|nr:hypothetical protein [Cohaesibacter marisflavi]